MGTKHTPGPWQSHDDDYCPEEIWGNLEGPLDGEIRGTLVCTVDDGPEMLGNIALLKAAPDLLYNLRESLEYWQMSVEAAGPDCNEIEYDAFLQAKSLVDRLDGREVAHTPGKSCECRTRELLAALRPFADLLESPEDYPDDTFECFVDVADIKRAIAAIAKAEAPQ